MHVEAGAAWVLGKTIIPAWFAVDPSEMIEVLRLRQGRKVNSSADQQSLVKEIAKLMEASPLPRDAVSGTAPPASHEHESFTALECWEGLLKVGPWSRDGASSTISGRGEHNYLLSKSDYKPPFEIRTKLTFSELSPLNPIADVNAGIVFGWTTPNGVRRYYNLLLSQNRMLLELIGDRGGNAYRDFRHIDEGIPFSVRPNETYDFVTKLQNNALTVVASDTSGSSWHYSSKLDADAFGRVGLRPWRSRITCHKFVVSTLL